MSSGIIGDLQSKARQFVTERDWNQYQNPKDMSTALAIEAAELMELFLWLNAQEVLEIKTNQQKFLAIKDEVADVFYWVIRLADILEIDLPTAFLEKLEKNKQKYPVESCKGKSAKYTELATQ